MRWELVSGNIPGLQMQGGALVSSTAVLTGIQLVAWFLYEGGKDWCFTFSWESQRSCVWFSTKPLSNHHLERGIA